MPRPLKRRPATVAHVPSKRTRRRPIKACHPSELDGRESKALVHHKTAAIAAVPELSPAEYELLIDPRYGEEQDQASRIIWSRAAALREKARELAGVGYEPE